MSFTGIVLIDGAVPRSEKERCQVLVDYLSSVNEERAYKFSADMEGDEGPGTGGEWVELENEICCAIADQGYVVSIGSHCPGDVVLWPKGVKEEITAAAAEEEGRFERIEGLPPGWRIDRSDGRMYYSSTWLHDDDSWAQ